MKQSVQDAYSALGLEKGSSLEEVKSAYKQIALRTHPDKNPDNPDATAQFQNVSEAYNVLLKHLDTSARDRPPRFPGFRFGDDSDDDYDDYDEFDDDYSDPEEDLMFYMFLFEELMRGRAHRNANMRFRREHVESETPEQYSARLRRSREEQIAGEERRKREAAARRAQVEMDRERDRAAAEQRQKAKVEAKKAQAKAQRSHAETAARNLQQQAQNKRSAVFAAARAGKKDEVKRGVWEENVDAAGGEVKVGCDEFVTSIPNDPQESLLHIAARNGDKDLVEWLDAHSADPEERDSRGFTAFHVALQFGHVPVVAYFLEEHTPPDSDSIYQPPAGTTLLSLALESHEPELVYEVLKNDLATQEDINFSWAWITSAKGRSAMKPRPGRKSSEDHEEKYSDILKLLMRFGGFTPPPTPSSSDNSDAEEQLSQNSKPSPLQTQVPPRSSAEARHPSTPKDSSPYSSQNQSARGSGARRGGKGGRGRGKKFKS